MGLAQARPNYCYYKADPKLGLIFKPDLQGIDFTDARDHVHYNNYYTLVLYTYIQSCLLIFMVDCLSIIHEIGPLENFPVAIFIINIIWYVFIYRVGRVL